MPRLDRTKKEVRALVQYHDAEILEETLRPLDFCITCYQEILEEADIEVFPIPHPNYNALDTYRCVGCGDKLMEEIDG